MTNIKNKLFTEWVDGGANWGVALEGADDRGRWELEECHVVFLFKCLKWKFSRIKRLFIS